MYAGKVDFIGIAGRNKLSAVKDFITTFGVEEFPHIFDSDGKIWVSYGIATQPAWIFIDSSGNTERIFGALGKAGLDSRVQDLLSN
jgi:hypothetical protein